MAKALDLLPGSPSRMRSSAVILVLRTANCSPVDHPEFVALRALKPVADFCRPVLVLQRMCSERIGGGMVIACDSNWPKFLVWDSRSPRPVAAPTCAAL
jgi:hypothetical protein